MFNIISAIIFNIDFPLQIIMVKMIPTDLARMSPVPGVLREDRMIANGKILQVWFLNHNILWTSTIHRRHSIVATMVGIWLSVKLKNIGYDGPLPLHCLWDLIIILMSNQSQTLDRSQMLVLLLNWQNIKILTTTFSEKFSTMVYNMTPRVELKHRTESNISGQLVGVASKVGCSRQRSSSSTSSLGWKLALESIFAYITWKA